MVTTMFEREQAVAALERTCAAAFDGRARALGLVGHAGLGKTTLLSHALSLAGTARVVEVTCSEAEATIPFGVFDRLLAGAGLAVGHSASPGRPIGADARLARYTELLDWLATRAPEALLLAVDDLHWADPDSVDLLGLCCRRLGPQPIAVVVTVRPWPSRALEQMRLLEHDRGAALEWLEPLSDAASCALILDRLDAPPADEQLAAALRAASGNPLLLGECAAALARGEDLHATSHERAAAHVFLPRFAGVGPDALRWARAASVLGTRCRPAVAGALCGQGELEAATSLERLCAAGLVRSGGVGIVEFVHPLVRQALYDDIPEPVRQGLHAAAFALLRARGAQASETLCHVLAADLSGDAAAIDELGRAGHEALRVGAVATAAEHLGRAVELAGSAAPPKQRLELAEAYLATGRIAAAEDSVRIVLACENLAIADRVTALRMLGQSQLASARLAAAKQSAAAASALAARFDPELATEILLDSAYIGWLFEGVHEARRSVGSVLADMGARSGAKLEPTVLEAAQLADDHLAAIGGAPGGHAHIAAAAAAALDAPGGPIRTPWRWDVLFGYANLAKISERFAESERFFDFLMEAAREQGAAVTLQTLAVNHADTLWRLGRLHEAYRLLERAAQLAQLVPGVAPFSLIGLAHLSDELGEDEQSERCAALVESMLQASMQSPYLRLWLTFLRCRRELRAGRVAGAAAAAAAAAELSSESGIEEPCIVPWHATAIEAHVAAGRFDDARRVALRLAEVAGPLPCRAPKAVATAGLATIAWRSGEDAAAELGYEEALASLEGVPMPLARGEALIAYGRFRRRTGRQAAARDLLHRAVELLEPIGAERLARQAREELSLAGGRKARRGPVGTLTAQEQRVTDLAAEGLTSAEIAGVLFLSRKTVDHHLSRAYAKLGIASRRALMRRELPGRPAPR